MRHIFIGFLFAGVGLQSVAVRAQEAVEPGVKFRVGGAVQSTDNFFASATAPVAEVTSSESLGLSWNKSFRQHTVNLDATVSNNEYQKYSSFNYVGSNVQAGWKWTAGKSWSGQATYDQTTAATPPSESQDPTQRNKSTTHNSQFGLGYEIGAGWQLNGGLVSGGTSNERAVIGQSDSQYSGANLGVLYVSPSVGSVSFVLQNATGNNPYQFSKRSADIKLITQGSGALTFTGDVMYSQQEYDAFHQYDFSGVSGGANINWQTTAKTSINFGFTRQLNANPQVDSIYSVVDTFNITPLWNITSKFTAKAVFQDSTYSAQGNPGAGASVQKDDLVVRSLALDWKPRESTVLTISMGNASRTSNVAAYNFTAQLLVLQATFTF
jgi:hypothetical protein